MNKILFLSVSLLYTSCSTHYSSFYDIKATIYLINETSNTILSDIGCDRDITPGDTLVYQEIVTSEYSETPSINNYFPFSIDYCNFYYATRDGKCESGLQHIENYENRKEVSPLVFEFTFCFTEERRAKAEKCPI